MARASEAMLQDWMYSRRQGIQLLEPLRYCLGTRTLAPDDPDWKLCSRAC